MPDRPARKARPALPRGRAPVPVRASVPSGAAVVVAAVPFQPRVETMTVSPGMTLAEILLEACLVGVLDPQDLPRTEVDVDGERVEDREAIAIFVPPPGALVNVTVQVYGGGRGGNKALQVLLQVAIQVAAFAIAGPAGNAFASFGQAAVQVARIATIIAVNAAGQALTHALLPTAKAEGAAAQTYALENQSNQTRLRQPMPLCLGERRWAFDLASSAFTTFSGDDTWLTAIYALHYGPCTLTDIKIGETLLTAFPAGEVQTETFLAPGPRNSALYPTDIHQDNFQNTLDRLHGDYALATTVDAAATVEFDFYWAGGLYYSKADGRTVNSDTKVLIEISPYGTNTWQPAPGLPAGVDKSGTAYPAGTFYTQAASKTPVRKTCKVVLPSAGKWDVRLKRDTRPVDDTNQDTVTWTAMRTPRAGKPVLDETLSILVLKVKASQDFSGALGVVSGVVTPIVPIPGPGRDWSTTAPSSNPAALTRWLVTGPAAAHPLAASEVDASCADQYDLIAANGWDAAVQANEGSQQDAINKLAAAGRFLICWSGVALVFTPDWEKPAPRQLFAGRNAQNYERRRVYPDPVHAVWVEFINHAADDKPDGLYVYADGYDATSATLVEALSLDYACTPARAHKEGRAWFARRLNQVRTHQWTAFVDGLAASRGDRARARRSSALYGLLDARVAFRRWAGALVSGVRLDAEVLMVAGESYALDVRRPDGLVLDLPIVTTPGRVREVSFAAPLPAGSAPGKGDLVAFGRVGQVTEDVEIADIDPRADGTVTIRAIDYIGPALVAAETGAIPPLTTFLSTRVAAPTPRILSAAGSPQGVTVGFEVDPQRTATLRGFVCRWRVTPGAGSAATWSTLPLIPAVERTVTTPPVAAAQHEAGDADGEVRVDVELWSLLATGEASPAATANGVLIYQGVLPVTGFAAVGATRAAPDGSSYPVLHVTATPVLSGTVTELLVELQPAGASPAAWVSAGQPLAAANPVGDYPAVASGKVYDVRARWRDSDGWKGPWSVVAGVVIPAGGLVAAGMGTVDGSTGVVTVKSAGQIIAGVSDALAGAAGAQSVALLAYGVRPNLCTNGGLADGLTGLDDGSGHTAADGGWTLETAGQWGPYAQHVGAGTHPLDWPAVPVDPGVTYTISADAGLLSATAGVAYIDGVWSNADDTTHLKIPGDHRFGPSPDQDFSDDATRRTGLALTATAPSWATKVYPRFVKDSVTGAGAVGRVRRMKVEKGIGATAWSDEAGLFGAFAGIADERSARAAAGYALATDVETVEARIVTNPNLIPNGGLENGLTDWGSSSTFWAIIDGVWGRWAEANCIPGSNTDLCSPVFPVSAGNTYTLASGLGLVGNVQSTDTIYLDAYVWPNKADAQALNYAAAGAYDGPSAAPLTGPHDFTPDDTNRSATVVTFTPTVTGWARVRAIAYSTSPSGSPAKARVRLAKMELGTVATAYSAEGSAQQLYGSVTETKIVALDSAGKLAVAYFSEVAEASGADPAYIKLASSILGGFLSLIADRVTLGSSDGSTILTALQLVGGRAYFTHPLYITGAGARVIIGPLFGVSSDLILWFGPESVTDTTASVDNAVFYLSASGAFVGGSAYPKATRSKVGSSTATITTTASNVVDLVFPGVPNPAVWNLSAAMAPANTTSGTPVSYSRSGTWAWIESPAGGGTEHQLAAGAFVVDYTGGGTDDSTVSGAVRDPASFGKPPPVAATLSGAVEVLFRVTLTAGGAFTATFNGGATALPG